ncbi:MAG: hypothetical protein RL000_153 [Bacteroidota bacterium]
MAYVKVLFTAFIFIAFTGLSHAQDLSNSRKKTIAVGTTPIKIDTLSIAPNSFIINELGSDYYRIEYSTATLFWLKPPPKLKYEVSYRVLPFNLSVSAQRLSFDSIFYRSGIEGTRLSGTKKDVRPFDFGKINSNGSIGRSLAFGNRQDAVFNSSLNLQLSGYIGDSILLNAAISDNNIPIQPDGNTQNLNEFDQVFIQFSKEKWKLALGDLDVRQNDLYFLNFYKRLQGVSFQTENNFSKQVSNRLMASGAVAKGKFTRNVFQGIEGNQGPYRLSGANQELFFIVLAGTERVFIDGELMQRGEDQDYIINYNTAEVTFMPRQMITKDKRIQIEFEYADRNYLNAQFFVNNRIAINDRLKLTVGFFGNNDAKNSPINQTLTPDQKQFLGGIGNDVKNAFYPSAVADTFSTTNILYRKIDSLIAPNIRDTIYIYEKNNAANLYSVSFTDVGQGAGDYVLDNSIAANGKVYKWVAPNLQTGEKNGRYAPVVLLVAPRKQQVMTIAADWEISKKSRLTADWAYSKYDFNLFSNKSSQDQNGFAGKLDYTNEFTIDSTKGWSLQANVGGEFANATFKPVERLRTVEFARDWGLDLVVQAADEKLFHAQMQLKQRLHHVLSYKVETYKRDKDFNALRNTIDHKYLSKGWRVNNVFVITQFNDALKSGYFLRPSVDMAKQIKQLNNREFSLKYTVERNFTQLKQTETISGNSFSFSTFQFATQSDPSKMNKWGFKYFTRADALPIDNKLSRSDRSHNYNLNGEWMSNEHHQIRLNATYRKLNVTDTRFNIKADERVLGRIEYFTDVWKNAITGNFLYELGSGQEPRRDFTYFEVPAGQGEYTWIDYNNDGIQQLNEFEIAKFRDQAKYLRIYTPTNDFVKTDFLQFNYNIVFNPSMAIADNTEGIMGKFIRRLYFQSSLQTSQKQRAFGDRSLNPFATMIADTSLISFDQLQTHSLSFNKFSQIWGVDLNYFQNTNRAFLSFGEETRRINEVSLRIRSNWARKYTIDLIGKKNNNKLLTPNFSNRNFNIESYSIEPRVSYTKGTTFRAQFSYNYQEKRNEGPERAKIKSLQMESKYNIVANTSLSGRFTMSDISFNGISSSTLGYIMMEGLQPNKNFVWQLDFTKRLNSFIEMSFQYEGRKAGSSGIVNLGRAQLRAIL